MSSSGELFVVAAPSGAGKTSLVNALVDSDEQLALSVSYTTRPARPGEVDGRHYHFTAPEAFARMVEAGEFLEWANVFGNCYGTHEGTTRAVLDSGRDVILEIDWQGARQVRERFPGCHGIFILPPSLAALRERLGRRGQDSAEVIAGRMEKARAEISHCGEFDFVVVNDDFDAALAELGTIIEACRHGHPPGGPRHEALLAELLENG
ncbi:guanylate kinase [Marinihelvus fidelis]|uniref:Guanylate kinase n=1 Tax=Marinihelvus fidelis TaxID=2613842 RepID=A0A5N0T970_9GAMM|nr:guanylate kinase [Marinihelvus fidelis]KAA9131278.1 guanylate kinase [Marinihelvus fidelis]